MKVSQPNDKKLNETREHYVERRATDNLLAKLMRRGRPIQKSKIAASEAKRERRSVIQTIGKRQFKKQAVLLAMAVGPWETAQ